MTTHTPNTPPNPFSTPGPWSLVSTGYAETTMGFLGQFSKTALEWANPSDQDHIVDIACGPGTLSRLAISQVRKINALDFSDDMITLFQAEIDRNGWQNQIHAMIGDGQSLPYSDNHFDAGFSMFGLMFFSDRIRGFSELCRVVKPGKPVVVSSWAPVSDSPAMMLMFGAMKAANPELPDPKANPLNLENPDRFKTEMEIAGFTDVSIRKVTHTLSVTSPDDFWDQMTRGSAPIVMMKQNKTATEWAELEQRAKAYIAKEWTSYPVIQSDAWLGMGTAT